MSQNVTINVQRMELVICCTPQ